MWDDQSADPRPAFQFTRTQFQHDQSIGISWPDTETSYSYNAS